MIDINTETVVITPGTSDEIRKGALDIVTNHTDVRFVVMDLSVIDSMRPTNLMSLVAAFKQLEAAEIKMALVGTQYVKQALEFTGLVRVFDIYHSCDAALASFTT